MEITAEVKFARISPKKVQPWLAGFRRKRVTEALSSLRYARSKSGKMLYKLIASAVANATNNYNFKTDNLEIKSLVANDGPRQKRYWLRSHGAADVKLKRMAHLKVVLQEITPIKVEKKVIPVSPAVAPKIAPAKLAGGSVKPAGPTGKADLAKLHGRWGGKKLFPRTTNK